MPLIYTILCILLISCFLLIGLLGLILPLIPGILFLLLAVLLLTRLSRRAKTRLYAQPWFNHQMRYLRTAAALPFRQKLSLGFLMLSRGVINALSSLAGLFSNKSTS